MSAPTKRDQKKIQSWIVLALFALSVLYSMLAVYVVIKGGAVSGRTGILWVIVFALLVALWTKNDKDKDREQKPYEYSFFVFLFWPIVLPYHLIRSRGIEGLLMFLGFLAMHELPSVVATMTWAYLMGGPSVLD